MTRANSPGWTSTRSCWCAGPDESMGSEWSSLRHPTRAPGGSARRRRWCWRPEPAPRCRPSRAWPRLDHGPIGTSPARRSCRGDSSSSEAASATYVGDELLVAAGRHPATTELGLETVGLTPGKPVQVDDQLRAVGVPGEWLYAVGDCNGRVLLTHMGKYQARIAADVILGKEIVDRASFDIVPRVTFTDPQVCAVGLTEAQAQER